MEAARLVCSSKNGREGLKAAAFGSSAGDYVNPNPNPDIILSPNISISNTPNPDPNATLKEEGRRTAGRSPLLWRARRCFSRR